MSDPSVYTLLSDVESPASLFHKVTRDEPTAFLFESCEGDSRLARFSLIGLDPIKTIAFKQGKAVITDILTKRTVTETTENPLRTLKHLLSEAQLRVGGLEQFGFPFTGGLVGYLGYGATQYFERIPAQAGDPFGVPEGFYGLYDTFIVVDHQFRKIHLVSYRGDSQIERILDRIHQGETLRPLLVNPETVVEDDIFATVTGPFTENSFCELVRTCKEYITAGEVFQIVPSQRFSRPVTSTPFDIYRTLVSLNPSPYAYYLKFPGFVYLGSSPETFVQCKDGQVVLRALAGTRPRGANPVEDEHLGQELRANEKELAEHRMLVDLGRNDMGRVCQIGTVKVGDIAQLVRYSHVMHLATEISGQLRPDKTVFDVFQGCFPRGTVSGAPKIRAMQLLSHLEPEQRGIYSGVVGYIDAAGNMDGAIAIRSALVKDGQAHVNAGAGVVFDSDPLAEYQETRNKAKSMLRAVQLAERMKRGVNSAAR
ncbi:MAG: anthranilate synthase component I family protein [Blastocatellia bacterium]|nr:anthranilate synthase component I family protein [Blastocatellia bacterium]